MTGYDIYSRALALLGYNDQVSELLPKNVLFERTLMIINWLLSDLKCDKISKLSEVINISNQKIDAVCSGTAMLLALSCGDSEKNRIYTDIYNSKRASVLSDIKFVSDTLPTVTG